MSGILLMLIAVVTPFLSSKLRTSPRVAWAVVAVIFAHQIATLLHITIGPLPTVDRDPIDFHNFANGTGGEHLENSRYAHLLRTLYQVFGASHLLGCEVSQLTFALALIVFSEMIECLELGAYRARLILFFGLPPSMVLNTSVVMRESAQILFFLLFCLSLLKLRRGESSSWMAVTIAAITCLIFLHKAYAILLFFTVLPFLGALWNRKALLVVVALFGVAFVGVFGGRILNKLRQTSQALDRVSSESGIDYVSKYATRVNESRTSFSGNLNFSSPVAFAISYPKILLQYLYSPFPWQIRGMKDLYGLFESFLRMGLSILALKTLTDRRQRGAVGFLLFIWIGIEGLWAAGTANWGTAFRHRLIGWGLLVLAGHIYKTKLSDVEQTSLPGHRRGQTPKPSIRSQIRDRRRRSQSLTKPNQL